MRLFPIWLFLGPRQVGKTSLLTHAGSDRQYISFDDLRVREAANRDPALFARDLRPPLILDEIQYAPGILSPIKQLADATDVPGAIWMSGSQNFKVMHGVRESLAGRVGILHLLGLSDEEKAHAPSTPEAFFEAVLRSGFPRLWPEPDRAARDLYLSSYTQTYIERDFRELLRVDKRREFETFLRLCAARTGCILNYDELARDAGVSATTIKNWLSVLEDSFLIYLAQPEHANRSKRLIKNPKMYFLDAGLAAYLSGWRDANALRFGPQAVFLLETHILSEILKYHWHRSLEVEVRFWRTRDGAEIDFLVESQGVVRPIEVKLGLPKARDLLRLEKIRDPRWVDGQVACLAVDQALPIAEDWRLVPVDGLTLA